MLMLTHIYGIHAVQAALEHTPGAIKLVRFDGQRADARLKSLLEALAQQGIALELTDRKKLDRHSDGKNHQGIIASVELPSMRSEDRLKDDFAALSETPFYLILDQVQDPHNLGACLRTADAVGVHGVIVPKDNAAGITPTVCKVASGAAETMPVYQVTNLARVLRWLKEQGVWLMGAAGEAQQSLYQQKLDMPLAIVLGAEG